MKGNIHWLSTAHAQSSELRLYDRLFRVPEAGAADSREALNPDSKRILTAFTEPALSQALPEERFQFERHGYFIADRSDGAPGRPVFNRAVSLRDSWSGRRG